MSALDVTPCTGQVTSGTAKRDVRWRRRSGKADEQFGRWQQVGAVPVLVVVMVRRRVMVGMLMLRIAVVLVRMVVRTGMVVTFVGEGVIIAGHRSSKAGVGVMRVVGLVLTTRSQ